ncbi:MAG: hypothetical protein CL878_01830, partial [Dehalococcoidia bacterium]|nr:hypothetical protein [Dehalococcoidia bacterium]
MTETASRPVGGRAHSAGSASVLETVRKVLTLEARSPRAYQDRSTHGGLAAFIKARIAEAPAGSRLHARLQQLHTLLSSYESLDTDARRTAIQRASSLAAEGTVVDQPTNSSRSQMSSPAERRAPPPAVDEP